MTRHVKVLKGGNYTEFLTGFYWLLLPAFVLQCIYYGNYRGRAKRTGWIVAIIVEFVRGILTATAHGYVYYYEQGQWSGRQLSRFLSRNGVPTFGWAWADGSVIFHVPAHLRGRADYLISRTQLPIEG